MNKQVQSCTHHSIHMQFVNQIPTSFDLDLLIHFLPQLSPCQIVNDSFDLTCHSVYFQSNTLFFCIICGAAFLHFPMNQLIKLKTMEISSSYNATVLHYMQYKYHSSHIMFLHVLCYIPLNFLCYSILRLHWKKKT
jgi:hypothetical protein